MLEPSWCKHQGVVSQTFRELSKTTWRKHTIPEITFMMRISSWDFVRVPKAWLWAHVQISAWYSHKKYDFCNTQMSTRRIFWRAREMLMKQPPGSPIMGRFWQIMDGFDKKKNNYANLLNCACQNTQECITITFTWDIERDNRWIFLLALWSHKV